MPLWQGWKTAFSIGFGLHCCSLLLLDLIGISLAFYSLQKLNTSTAIIAIFCCNLIPVLLIVFPVAVDDFYLHTHSYIDRCRENLCITIFLKIPVCIMVFALMWMLHAICLLLCHNIAIINTFLLNRNIGLQRFKTQPEWIAIINWMLYTDRNKENMKQRLICVNYYMIKKFSYLNDLFKNMELAIFKDYNQNGNCKSLKLKRLRHDPQIQTVPSIIMILVRESIFGSKNMERRMSQKLSNLCSIFYAVIYLISFILMGFTFNIVIITHSLQANDNLGIYCIGYLIIEILVLLVVMRDIIQKFYYLLHILPMCGDQESPNMALLDSNNDEIIEELHKLYLTLFCLDDAMFILNQRFGDNVGDIIAQYAGLGEYSTEIVPSPIGKKQRIFNKKHHHLVSDMLKQPIICSILTPTGLPNN